MRITIHSTTILLLCGACSKHPPTVATSPEPDPVRVKVLQVAKQDLQGREEVVGTVRAKLRATLEAKVSGRIKRMPIKLGQRVKRGQVLLRLDAGEIDAKVVQARAVRRQAQSEMQRYATLLKQQAVTQQEFDGVRSRYQVAASAEKEAKTMLSYTLVKAPFSAVVTHKFVDQGDLATPGRPLLELEDPTHLIFEVALPAALIGFVSVGSSVPVRVQNQQNDLVGTVVEVAPAADPNSRTFRAKLDLPRDTSLRSGQFGRALVPTGRNEVIKVPRTAVVRRGQLDLVFVTGEGRAKLRLVRTGKVFGDEVEVAAGLDGRETLVVQGAAKLVDNQRIEIAP